MMNLTAAAAVVLREMDEIKTKLDALAIAGEWTPRADDENICTGGFESLALTSETVIYTIESRGETFIRSMSLVLASLVEDVNITIVYNGHKTKFIAQTSMTRSPMWAVFGPGKVELLAANATAGALKIAWHVEGFIRYPEMEVPDLEQG